jgi:hypothetical protein
MKAGSSAFTSRCKTGIWFALSAVVATILYFQHLSMAPRGVVLYVAAPGLSAGIGGFIWGAVILDPAQVNSYGAAVRRGGLVGLASFVIFAGIYACILPTIERGWSAGAAARVFVLTLTLGAFIGLPLSAISGVVSGAVLLRVRRSVRHLT